LTSFENWAIKPPAGPQYTWLVTENEQKSTLKRPSAWIGFGLIGLGAVTLAIAFGGILPTLPGGGPHVHLPKTLTVTTASGKQATLHIGEGGSRWAPRENFGDSDSEQSFAIQSIDTTSHVPASIPVTTGQRDPSEPVAGVGPAATWRTRLTTQVTDTATGRVTRADDTDVWQVYYVTAGSALPTFTSRQLATRKPGATLTSVTSADRTVVELNPSGAYQVDVGAKYFPYEVYFDLAALHETGRTTMTFPLAWYASSVVRWIETASPWATALLWLAALALFVRIGAIRTAIKRREWAARSERLTSVATESMEESK
jgi:hypothetical protein